MQFLEHKLIFNYNPNNTNTWHIKNKYGLIIELFAIYIIILWYQRFQHY